MYEKDHNIGTEQCHAFKRQSVETLQSKSHVTLG